MQFSFFKHLSAKLHIMEKEKILSADVLDIIFEGRNKAYGAYALRKHYDERLWKAIGTMVALLLIIFVLFKTFKEKEVIYAKEYVMEENRTGSVKMPEKSKKSTPVPAKSSSAKSGQTSNIQIVKTAGPIKSATGPGSNVPDTSGFPGTGTGIKTGGPFPSDSIGGKTPDSVQNIVPFVSKMVNASFPGGDVAWKKYLERYLDSETAINHNAPAGVYKVIVVFMVNTQGKISDVKAETNFGYGMEAEAIRVIKKGPDWVPASQNDEKLNVYRRQPVTFIVAE